MSSPESLTSNTPFRSGRLRANITTFFLAAYLLVLLLSIASSLLYRSVYSGVAGGAEISEEQEAVLQLMTGGVALLHIAALIACVVSFCFWIHRAYLNLHALGNPRSSLEYSPGWAVGFFFIPFVNLVVPYRVVKEIWVKSDPRVRTQEDYLYAPPVSTALVLTWWLTWIASNVLLRIANRLYDGSRDAETIVWTTNVDLFANCVRIAATVLAVLVVRGIDRRQEERSRYVTYAESAPPPPPLFAPPPPPVFAPPPAHVTAADPAAPPPAERVNP